MEPTQDPAELLSASLEALTPLPQLSKTLRSSSLSSKTPSVHGSTDQETSSPSSYQPMEPHPSPGTTTAFPRDWVETTAERSVERSTKLDFTVSLHLPEIAEVLRLNPTTLLTSNQEPSLKVTIILFSQQHSWRSQQKRSSCLWPLSGWKSTDCCW